MNLKGTVLGFLFRFVPQRQLAELLAAALELLCDDCKAKVHEHLENAVAEQK